jgi:hypothetical protein
MRNRRKRCRKRRKKRPWIFWLGVWETWSVIGLWLREGFWRQCEIFWLGVREIWSGSGSGSCRESVVGVWSLLENVWGSARDWYDWTQIFWLDV